MDEWEAEGGEETEAEEAVASAEEERRTRVDPEAEEEEGDWEEEVLEEEGRVPQRPRRSSSWTRYDSRWVHPCASQSRCHSSSRIVSSPW